MQSGASSVGLRIRRHDTTRRVAVQHAIAIGARQVGSVRDQLRDAHEGMLDAGNAIQETAAAPPQKSSPPFRRSFAFAPRGMRSAQSCARCLCGSARHVLRVACVAWYDEPHIISELRKVCVGSAHVHAFVYIVLHAGGACSHIGRTRRAGGCEAGARTRVFACVRLRVAAVAYGARECAASSETAARDSGTGVRSPTAQRRVIAVGAV